MIMQGVKLDLSKGIVRFDSNMRPLIEDVLKCCGVNTLEELLGSSKDIEYLVFDGYLDEMMWDLMLRKHFTEEDSEEYYGARNLIFNPYFQILGKLG